MNNQLKDALEDLNVCIRRFNKHMEEQMLGNLEVKYRLAENKILLENMLKESLHDQNNND